MPRMLDLKCPQCEEILVDVFMMNVPEHIIHFPCRTEMDVVVGYYRPRSAQWSEGDKVVIFKKPDGTYSFPATNSKATPPGCERIEARSDRELAKIEKMTNTLNESRHFDRNGRGFDDTFRGERYT